jgi:hypothetical protein
MNREHVLAVSVMAALITVSGVAYAGPGITDKSYWPSEAGPSSYHTSYLRTPTQPDRYRARAMVGGREWSRARIGPEGSSSQPRCRYLGGPKYPTTC